MKAAIFKAPGAPLAIETVPDPTPGLRELVIKVEACGICGSDLHAADIHDDEGGMKPLPPGTIMGHEFSGTVVAVGEDALGFQPGMRVTALPYLGCGQCLACLSGTLRCERGGRGMGFGRVPGAYAEYALTGAHETLPLPDAVDDIAGAMVEPLAVGLHAVHAAKLRPDDSALVMGAGPIGLAVTAWCRFFGARQVVTSDPVRPRLDLAGDFGATLCLDPGEGDLMARVKSAIGARPRVVFDCIGIPGSQQLAMDHAPVLGQVVVVGVCMQPDRILPVKAITKELHVAYVFGYRRQDFAFTIDMLAQGRLAARRMLSHTIGFDTFPTAFERLKTSKNECKVILLPK